jgi:hypothetical protein
MQKNCRHDNKGKPFVYRNTRNHVRIVYQQAQDAVREVNPEKAEQGIDADDPCHSQLIFLISQILNNSLNHKHAPRLVPFGTYSAAMEICVLLQSRPNLFTGRANLVILNLNLDLVGLRFKDKLLP